MKAGIYDMTAAEYHADPCPAPSLSASVAHRLLTQSPAHAYHCHPKLGQGKQDDAEHFDLGTAAHAYLLEGETGFALIDAKDWRTKAAQEQREAARAEGKTPLLLRQWDDVRAMAGAARVQLGALPRPVPLLDGRAEETLIWQERGIWCRARLDWLRGDLAWIEDYKTTSGTAHPEAWARGALFENGYDLQAAWYVRGAKAVLGAEPDFRFVVQENYPPYALSVIGLAPDVWTLATKKALAAIELWAQCLETGSWPAYPTQTCYAELPAWREAAWMEREERELQAEEKTR